MSRIAAALLALPALALTSTGSAQGSTWIVDAARGAGHHYTDIPPAIARAAHGDTILVRPGVYTPFTLNRAVALLGGPGVKIGARTWINVWQIPAGRVASIQDVDIGDNLLSVHGCKGQVLIEGLRVDANNQDSVRVTGGSTVQLVRSTVNSLKVAWSRVAVMGGRIGNGLVQYPLTLNGARVTLASCNVRGGLYWTSGTPAVRVDATSVLTLTGDGSAVLSVAAGAGASVVVGTGTVVLDPRVVLKPDPRAPAIANGVRVVRRSVPFLRARGAPLGGTVRVTMSAGSNQPFFLAIGAPGATTSVPGLAGEVWLDLRTAILIGAGQLDARGGFVWSIPVPRDNVLRGLTLVWQGTAGPSLAQQALSNPSAYVHGPR